MTITDLSTIVVKDCTKRPSCLACSSVWVYKLHGWSSSTPCQLPSPNKATKDMLGADRTPQALHRVLWSHTSTSTGDQAWQGSVTDCIGHLDHTHAHHCHLKKIFKALVIFLICWQPIGQFSLFKLSLFKKLRKKR